jgi:hypothetical protein
LAYKRAATADHWLIPKRLCRRIATTNAIAPILARLSRIRCWVDTRTGNKADLFDMPAQSLATSKLLHIELFADGRFANRKRSRTGNQGHK